jgi:hypothetical protein
MQYNTDQWIIMNYPVGAGGKFLTACFFQFRRVAHWAKKPLTVEESVDWYCKSLPNGPHDLWSTGEIDTPWVIPVSRQWPRGENLSESEFDSQLSTTGGQYFDQCWQEGKFIVDFWHKTKRPPWWTNAHWITIVVDDMPLYKKLLFSKLFEYQADKKIMISNDQKPEIGRPEHKLNKSLFNNPWRWENVSGTEEFFEQYITQMPWYTSWNFDHAVPENYILLSELFDTDKVFEFLCKYQDLFGQQVNRDYVNAIHSLWLDSTIKKINQSQ